MHSLAQRVSTLSSIVTTICFAAIALVSIMTLAIPQGSVNSLRFRSSKPIVTLKNTRNYGATKNTPKENARFKFDIVADFSDLVDWNTKQIFTYVYVELDDVFGSDDNKSNKLVVWDKILTEKDKMYINYKNLKSKYSIWDYDPELHGRTGHFKLGYNIQPYVGPLSFGEVDLNNTFTFPATKV
ncbi:unnamed protein product [Pichia kudriavzevii]|uniref:Signal peptidase subunit 3 n=2 Tax=Pichia kudriavzevii TaxID=4909 RepID=A0A099P111_PICKU|nr:hypothetical protein JL09_g2902 [Pichia kudriavzevii]